MIGTDIVQIERISHFRERFGDKALRRFLSSSEISLIKSDASAAGFWAAKEAISKALGTGIGEVCGFHDINIYKDAKGAPKFTLSSHLIEAYEITSLSLTIAHDGGFAIAVAAIEGKASVQNLAH